MSEINLEGLMSFMCSEKGPSLRPVMQESTNNNSPTKLVCPNCDAIFENSTNLSKCTKCDTLLLNPPYAEVVPSFRTRKVKEGCSKPKKDKKVMKKEKKVKKEKKADKKKVKEEVTPKEEKPFYLEYGLTEDWMNKAYKFMQHYLTEMTDVFMDLYWFNNKAKSKDILDWIVKNKSDVIKKEIPESPATYLLEALEALGAVHPIPGGSEEVKWDATKDFSKENITAVTVVKEQEGEKLRVVARGIEDKTDAENVARTKRGEVVQDDNDEKLFMVVVKEGKQLLEKLTQTFSTTVDVILHPEGFGERIKVITRRIDLKYQFNFDYSSEGVEDADIVFIDPEVMTLEYKDDNGDVQTLDVNLNEADIVWNEGNSYRPTDISIKNGPTQGPEAEPGETLDVAVTVNYLKPASFIASQM